MRCALLVGLSVVGCSFNGSGLHSSGDGGRPGSDGGLPGADAPPTAADVRFTSVAASVDEIRPGAYGIEVEATLQNDLDVAISGVAASLTFADGSGDRAADFRWRDFDMREGAEGGQPSTIPAGGEATYRFVVDALPRAAPPGPIFVNGEATFLAEGSSASATPLESPLALEFAAANPPIVVTAAGDEDDGDNELCFREALEQAIATPGLDRIVFDPEEFPPGEATLSTLDEQLGPLPELTGAGGDLVIDGSGAGFHLAADSNWEDPEGRYGLRLTGGRLVVHGIGFQDFGYNYRDEGDLDQNNCGSSGAQLEGGAIRVDGGTLILDGNVFADPNVDERNCFAASVRLHGGSGHRILNNRWTDPSMDSLYIDAATVEVSGNAMDAGSDPSKADECIYVEGQGGSDLWITGNLCVDQEFSAVIARGTGEGRLYVVHNTFGRNGRVSLSALRRELGARPVVLRNNVYIDNSPAALDPDSDGAGFDIAFEAVTGSPLCAGGCSSAAIDSATILDPSDPGFADAGGTTWEHFTPRTGSPLRGSALDWLDRNGEAPGRYEGEGPDRGAVEVP